MTAHISIPMYNRSIDQRYKLIGMKCSECGEINFPPKSVCRYCGKGTTYKEIILSGRGKIYSYTIVSGPGAPPEFEREALARIKYPVVLVELDEGPRIVAQMADCDLAKIEIGARVRVVIRRIYEEEGVIRYGYKFVLDN